MHLKKINEKSRENKKIEKNHKLGIKEVNMLVQ